MRGDARRWPVREELLLSTHVIVNLLKAWKVTVVWIECHDDVFFNTFQDGTNQIVSSRKKSKFCKQGGKLDYSRYSQVSLLKITSYISLSAILYILSFSSLSFKFDVLTR